jgi:hypothetical protein
MKTNKPCKASKENGSRCEATRLADSDYCYFHDPSKAAERREAQALGGQHNRMRTLDEAAPDIRVENTGDVLALLSETINQVRKGVIDPRVANAVGYLANLQIRALEQHAIERRMTILEELREDRITALGGGS